jgi:hypothetical protein
MNTAEQDKQVADAEELLGDRLGKPDLQRGCSSANFLGIGCQQCEP